MNRAHPVAFSIGLLIVLIAVTPVPAVMPGWLGPQLLTLAVAVLLFVLPAAPPGDIKRCIAIFKPLAAAALLPAAWMLLQIVPLPLGSIEHPIWRSAAAALAEPKPGSIGFGHISIDLGTTLRGLFGYLGLISLVFVTAILTRNRDRAETIFTALCAITTFAAVELILQRDLPLLSAADSTTELVALAAFGGSLNTAFIVRAIERHESTPKQRARPWQTYVGTLLLGCICTLTCLIALIQAAAFNILIAAVFGTTVVGLVVLVRRLSLGRWSIATICVALLVAWGGVIALRFAANSTVSPLFRFSEIGAAEAVDGVLRMISDADWKGAGVGNYPALATIYRDAAGTPGSAAINTVASMVLEWGRAGLLLAMVLVIQLAVVLFRGALSRNRDSFYAAGSAACLATAFCEAYCDTSFTDITVQMLAAIIIGLGLSQTTGLHAS